VYPWLQIGPLRLSTYSICFLAAYAIGGWAVFREAQRRGRATEQMMQVTLGGLGGGVIGAKLSMLLFLGPQSFLHHLPQLQYSGQAWTGAFFGGYLGVIGVKHWKGISYATGDVFALGLPLAQAIGRLGNLLGGDPFGLPSNLPWAVVQHGVRRQPSALYELVLDLVLLCLLLFMRDRMPRAGDLFKLYVVSYCSLRFMVDFTRADPHVLLGLTWVQVLYAPTFAWFSFKLWWSYREIADLRGGVREPLTQTA
jgi:phosphatidylglycerol---prolipoprotein diacylglyceryl transferase